MKSNGPHYYLVLSTVCLALRLIELKHSKKVDIYVYYGCCDLEVPYDLIKKERFYCLII